jgi:hypothetical protein
MDIRIVLFLLGTYFVLPGLTSGQANRTQEAEIADQLVSIAQDILAGHNTVATASTIAPGARLVSGPSNVDLRDVVTGADRTVTLVDRPPRQTNALRLKTNENEDSAFLLLTTSNQGKDVRYHTVVFMRDKHGEWKVETWHASSQ